MKLFVAILLSGVFLIPACNGRLGINLTQGSGKIITEPRTVSNFHQVTLAGVGDLNITEGDTESLTIEADDNLIPLIETRVENGELVIGIDRNRGNISMNPTRPIKYTLSVKNLDAITVSGAGNVSAPSLKSDNFAIVTSGAGNVNLQKLETKALKVTVSGAGNILLAGRAETQDTSLSGLGSYDAGNLATTATSIRLTGAGSATLWASDTLNVQVSGAGSISYYGSPKVTQSISGIGSVKNLGNK